MTWLSDVLLILAGLFGGGLVVGIVVVPWVERRAYERGLEARRVIDGVAELRETRPWPKPLTARDTDTTMDLPVQLGTLPEHRRRPPLRFGEVTDAAVLDAVEENPHGAEPAFGQVRVGVTGRALPANVWGNAAPTLEEEAPLYAGGPAGSWPLVWWVVWLALLPVHYLVGWRHFWDTAPGQRVDRAAVWLGRYEPRWFHDEPAPRHAAARDLDGEAERRRLALFEPTQELKTVEPVRELVGVGT